VSRARSCSPPSGAAISTCTQRAEVGVALTRTASATNNALEVVVGRSHLEQHVRRVLLGETPESEPETPEAEAAELAGLKRGYYLLDTDGGNAGTHPLHHARVLSQ
jgi:hypothetical protein